MPELPEITAYIWTLENLIQGENLKKVILKSPFVLRSVEPRLSDAEGRCVVGFKRLGKRIVWDLGDEFYLVFHLMVGGRFRWVDESVLPKKKSELAAFHFERGTLMLTEIGTKKRASLHVIKGSSGLNQHDPGGTEIIDAGLEDFLKVLTRENHTSKRALTDPRILSGIGNVYSDEILYRAGVSPLKWTSRLEQTEIQKLFLACQSVMGEKIEGYRIKQGHTFPPENKKGLKVHGRKGEICPACEAKIQEIRYQDRSTFYCPGCQTGGRLLADRGLSRLLKGDWP